LDFFGVLFAAFSSSCYRYGLLGIFVSMHPSRL
jgi:hypothetical protein